MSVVSGCGDSGSGHEDSGSGCDDSGSGCDDSGSGCDDSGSEWDGGSEYVSDTNSEGDTDSDSFLPVTGINRGAKRKWCASLKKLKFLSFAAADHAVPPSYTSIGHGIQGQGAANDSVDTIVSSTVHADHQVQATADCSFTSSTTANQPIKVQMANNIDGKRKWDKAAKCNFCERMSTSNNITKHMLSVHKNTAEVAEILSKEKHSTERKLLIERLRNLGNYKHNCEVLKSGKGMIIAWRSPSEQVSASEYSPCEHCLGFFLKKDLWRHSNKCNFQSTTRKRRQVLSGSQMLLPAAVKCSDGLKEHVFSNMTCDDVTLAARNDSLIISFGEKLFQKHGDLHVPYIRQKLRELSRFLLLARKVDSSITDLQSCIEPGKFPSLIQAVRELCGYSSMGNRFTNPSLALKLGHTLKKIAITLRSKALIEGNTQLKDRCEAFKDLCDAEWSSYISSSALTTLETQKWNKPHRLPLTDDVRLVSEYLKEERKKRLENVRAHPSTESWHALAKVSLANIILFNRRRSGEAAKMLMSDYTAASCNGIPSDDVLQALSELEKKLVNNFQRVEIRGKHGRKVPVLLTESMVEEIDALNDLRADVGVSQTNKYVFARPYFQSQHHMSGHQTLHEAAHQSGAKEPSNITGTRLRKHLATVCQVLNLAEHELEQICTYMGHNISVHREFYRLPEDTYQLAKVSRLLLCMESGQLSKFHGKTLQDIDVNPDFSDSEVEGGASKAVVSDEEETTVTATCVTSVENQQIAQLCNTPRRDQKMASTSSGESQESSDSRCKRSTPAQKIVSKSSHTNSKKKMAKASYVSETPRNRDFLSAEQKQLIHNHFKNHILERSVPGKSECEEFIRSNYLFSSKSWQKVKCSVRNEIEKTRRQIKKLQS